MSKLENLGRWMDGWIDGWVGGWVDGGMNGWMEAKAGLRIAYSNQKFMTPYIKNGLA